MVENGGIIFDVGGEDLWRKLEESGVDPWKVNEAFLRQQLETGVERIEFVSGNIWDVLEAAPETSFRVKEIQWLLGNVDKYDYELIGNSWVKKTP